MMLAILTVALAQSGTDRPIDIPYQIRPAYLAYTDCVAGQLRRDHRFGSSDLAAAGTANLDAITACREVRNYELARALRMQTDHRMYGSRAKAHAAVKLAFDRFDKDFDIEPVRGK